jgi:hypothetical protein
MTGCLLREIEKPTQQKQIIAAKRITPKNT